ncbi:MAG: group II truncated hemoglobin [Alphaproteobacteria bacterium]
MSADQRPYGTGDASFQAAGGYEGIKRLVDDFYDIMQAREDAQRILRMHPRDLDVSRDKLTRFLCGWTGGPKLYSEKYGSITIPGVHAHLDIAEAERDAWLACMQDALAQQPYAEDFKAYLLRELGVPAERVRIMAQKRKAASKAG